jgi:hypothetical protein
MLGWPWIGLLVGALALYGILSVLKKRTVLLSVRGR